MRTMCPPGYQWLWGNSCTWAHDVWLMYMMHGLTLSYLMMMHSDLYYNFHQEKFL